MSEPKSVLTRPADHVQAGGRANQGMISFTLSCSEIEGRKTVHLETHGNFPFGHIYKNGVKDAITWLKEAQQWLEK